LKNGVIDYPDISPGFNLRNKLPWFALSFPFIFKFALSFPFIFKFALSFPFIFKLSVNFFAIIGDSGFFS
jgi:hypothetical protein